MANRISDYALIGDRNTAALVGRDGSIDFLCWPHFHSEACFTALLGTADNGCWSMAPVAACTTARRYRGDTAVLETRFRTDDGVATAIDFMPVCTSAAGGSAVVRLLTGESGQVRMRTRVAPRFDYGRLAPRVRQRDCRAATFVCGPHAATLSAEVPIACDQHGAQATFTIGAGERKAFVLQYHRSYDDPPTAPDAAATLAATERWWRDWAQRCAYRGPARDAVVRSLITMKALTSWRTGGIVAAATLGLPEKAGGERNWDYRFCWLRDATFTLLALMHSGYRDEAGEWRDWLLRAVAAMPDKVQPVYGVAGEHRLPEWEIDWLAGYGGARPVRAGNAAFRQLQLDVYGEIVDCLHQARNAGIRSEDWSWQLQREIVAQVECIWREPDCGIWESRQDREHFVHSRVLAWAAVDRAVRAAERHSLDWPCARWRALREEIHRDVCSQGYDDGAGFVRSYETREPDAANLMIPLVGFLPADDPRVRETVATVERKLMIDGFIMRYDTARSADGMPQGEGAFLPCSFWYVDNLVMQGRMDEARRQFEKLLTVRNDVGLLSEEYDPETGEMLGNFPQVMTHLSLVNSAHNLETGIGPLRVRSGQEVAP